MVRVMCHFRKSCDLANGTVWSGGYDKITCGAFLLSQQLFSPLALYGNLNLPFLSVFMQSGRAWC